MAKRACGTCRFFEQSGIGEMGYCRNVRCKEIVGIALVRRQELACRIGWNDDYFEPLADAALPGEQRPNLDTVRQRSGFQGTRPNDIIIGVEQPRPVTEREPMQGARSRTSNVGEAHRRALERRQLAQQSGDDSYAPRRLDPAAPPDADAPPGDYLSGAPAARPAARGDEGVSTPRRVEGITAPGYSESPDANTAAIPLPPEVVGTVAGTGEYAAAPAWSPAPQPAFAPEYSQEQVPPPGYAPQRAEYAPPAPQPPFAPQPQQRSALDAEWEAQERQRHRGKRCANCRDFQIAEGGDRGWCRNRFAFPTPQVVGPNDLACLSAIGTWWAANDQWWLAKAVPAARTEVQTPLADALIEDLREEQRRRAASRRPNTG